MWYHFRSSVKFYKIASADLVNLPLINYVASKQKPIILSTGMSNLSQIEDAVNEVKKTQNPNLALLHCNSSYPAPIEDLNFNSIKTLKDRGVPANFPAHFTVNDFIVGPRLKYGARTIGYISKADENDIEKDEFNPIYVTQKVTIRGATETDYLAWKNLSSGATIQRAHFYKSREAHVDQNTSEVVIGEYSNDFKLFDELPFSFQNPTVNKDKTSPNYGKPT